MSMPEGGCWVSRPPGKAMMHPDGSLQAAGDGILDSTTMTEDPAQDTQTPVSHRSLASLQAG